MKKPLAQNLTFMTISFVMKDVIWDILYWPIWWYSRGLMKIINLLSEEILHYEHRLGLGMWVKNMFRPMYGQSDIQGRIISVFMRIVVLFWRVFSFVAWTLILVALFLAWLFVLPYAVYQAGVNFFHFFTLG